MLEVVERRICLLDALEVLEMLEVSKVLEAMRKLETLDVMRRVLLCMLEAVDGEHYLLEVLELIRCVRLDIPSAANALCN